MQTEETVEKGRGRPVTCQVCDHKFRIPDKEQKKLWVDDRMFCPKCLENYCCLPDTERQLRPLQDKYLKTKDQKYMTAIYNILVPYSQSMIKQEYSNLIESPEWLEYHSHNASLLVIEEYYKVKCGVCGRRVTSDGDDIGQVCKCDIPDTLENTFKINLSFGGYLKTKVMQSVIPKKQKKKFIEVSIDEQDSEGNTILQIADTRSEYTGNDYEQDKVIVGKYTVDLIYQAKTACTNRYDNFARLIGVRNHLRKNERESNKFYRHWTRKGKEEYQVTMGVIENELLKMSVV